MFSHSLVSGGSGNRTRVLRYFHISVYIISTLYSHNEQSYPTYRSQMGVPSFHF